MIKKPSLKSILTVFYAVFFAVYLYIGFQPNVEAVNYEISNQLIIPSINLNAPVTPLEVKSGELETPVSIVGSFSTASNKTLLIGHASGIFQNLPAVQVGDILNYDGQSFKVVNIETLPKESVNMQKILANTKRQVLKIMTCAGELFENGDATHRLIITAVKEES